MVLNTYIHLNFDASFDKFCFIGGRIFMAKKNATFVFAAIKNNSKLFRGSK